MPFDQQFCGDYFGSFTDKYGIKWMVDRPPQRPSSRRLTR